VASPRLRRSMKAGLAASAAAVVAGAISIPATAQPTDPSIESDALKRYHALGAQAGKADEDMVTAEEAFNAKRAELDKAKADAGRARQLEGERNVRVEQMRGRVDQFAGAAYRGAGLDQVTAVLVSANPTDFLERSTMLGVVSADKKQVLDTFTSAATQAADARKQAESAEQRAQAATDAAAKLLSDVQQRKRDLDGQIKQVRQALNALSASEKASLRKPVDTGSYLGPPGSANTALQAALSKRGSEYEWGSKGPTTFDCSGLTYWAYKQAGITLPGNSRGQWGVGKPVSQDQLQPGDLVFYDDGSGDPSQIHHVAMYVGSGKMVDAPTEGQLVDIRSIRGDGHYIGARRIVG
jgi:peptidoglycan DL-endopeptidase CwlO